MSDATKLLDDTLALAFDSLVKGVEGSIQFSHAGEVYVATVREGVLYIRNVKLSKWPIHDQYGARAQSGRIDWCGYTEEGDGGKGNDHK